MAKKINLLLIGFFALSWCFSYSGFAQENIDIRILIIKPSNGFDLKIISSFKIFDPNSKEILYESDHPQSFKVRLENGLVNFSRLGFGLSQASISLSERNGYFLINDRKYSGSLKVIAKGDSISVINLIGLEDYLKSVVPSEMPWYWPYEALKAQAIVARTFAIYNTKVNKSKDYDLDDSTYSQVYTGKGSNRYRSSKAVEETRGMVLEFDKKTFPTFFHSTCGGYTEDASNLWEANNVCLMGSVCAYCAKSPHFRWYKTIEKNDLLNKLKNNSISIDKIHKIIITKINRSARVDEICLDTGEKRVFLSGKDFRRIIGPQEIRSLKFDIAVTGDKILIEGFGWGHGVGLCQWGAYFMAREGFGFKRILSYYYPKSVITSYQKCN